MSQVFDQAIQFTSLNEGGIVDNPLDKGGLTNMGITNDDLKRFSAAILGHEYVPHLNGFIAITDLAHLTPEQMEEVIVEEGYWIDGFEKITPIIAIKTFDFGFNMGIRSGVKLLQRAVNAISKSGGLVEDGAFGPKSIALTNKQAPNALLAALILQAKSHYYAIVMLDSSQSVFLKGWLLRAARMPTLSS